MDDGHQCIRIWPLSVRAVLLYLAESRHVPIELSDDLVGSRLPAQVHQPVVVLIYRSLANDIRSFRIPRHTRPEHVLSGNDIRPGVDFILEETVERQFELIRFVILYPVPGLYSGTR
jgi:hypothetical protein